MEKHEVSSIFTQKITTYRGIRNIDFSYLVNIFAKQPESSV